MEVNEEKICSSTFPALQERRYRLGAAVLKLLLVLGVQQVAVGVQNGKCGHTFANRDVVFGRDVHVMVHVADVHMDHNIILREKLGIRSLMVVEIEHLTVATPVPTEVEQDALVVMACDTLGRIDFVVGVCRFGVEILVHVECGLR